MSKDQWVSQIFQTSEAGVSSAFEPELIPDNQLAWMKNGVIRGGKPHTRTPLRFRLVLPSGKLQGVGFFSIQNGMLVASIGGRIYRIRVGTKTSGFSWEEIPLDWRNSATQDFAWMQETVGFLVIQDGQSNPIIYDGSVARRSDTAEGEVPLGRQMAYGNGRLWVAINEQELVAGDIKTRTPGSELLFTETGYLSGGGALISPQKITGMGFIPAAGASGYGQLVVGGKNACSTARADITSRDQWATWPGFVQTVLLDSGIASHFSIAQVNQDLFWRDGQGGIRSLRSAMVDEASGPGNTPQSREVSRITDFEDQKRLNAVSAIQFNNRLLMTASPFINDYGAVSFRDIISLDFSPISSNRSKTAPSYDGEWEGLEFTRLIAGEFNGKKRGFALSLDPDGNNRLWEFDDGVNDDELQVCTGTGIATQDSPIPMVLEYPSRDFGSPGARKVLQRCDVYLAGIEGEVSLDVYWRSDNLVKWNQWQEEVTACAVMEDDSTTTPHVWKNLAPQGRAQIKTFSIPQTTQPLTGYGNQTGFEHQIRIVVTGKARVDRVIVHATAPTQEQFSLRDNASFAVCAEQDVTGNAINYTLEPSSCPPVLTYLVDDVEVNDGDVVDFGTVEFGEPVDKVLSIRNDGEVDAIITSIGYSPGSAGFSVIDEDLPITVRAGDTADVTIRATAVITGTSTADLIVESNGDEETFTLGATANMLGPLNPDDIPNLDLWIDASQLTGLNDGEALTTGVQDTIVPAGLSVSYAGATYKTNAAGSLPAIRLSGSSGSHIYPQSNGFTLRDLFIVARVRTSTFSNDFLFQHGTEGPNGNQLFAASGVLWNLSNVPLGSYSINGVTSLTGESGIPDIQIYRVKTQFALEIAQEIVFGNNFSFGGQACPCDIMEICGYETGVVSEANAVRLLAGLQQKWGTPS